MSGEDVGDGWAARTRAAEDYAALCRREAAETSELLRLSIEKHVALTSALSDLVDLLRKPHPDQHPEYDLACRDVAARLHTLLAPASTPARPT